MTRRSIRLPIVTVWLTVLTASTAVSQSNSPRPRHAAAIVAGASQFDLSGTGTTSLIGGRVEADLQSWLVAEGSVGFFRPLEQSGRRARYLIPEAQLQVQVPGHMVRPYLGFGGGYVFTSGSDAEPTASGAAGLRIALPGMLDLRSELRVRGIGTGFSGSTAEWTLGLGYRF